MATGPTEIDTVAFDQFTATSGTFHASSSNSATLTYGIGGGTAGSTVLDGVTYDLSRTGPFGTLYLNSTTGAFSFVPDGGAINALTATTITSFTVTVSDGTLSASRTFPITINGVNDAAVISGTTAGAVIEAGVAMPGAPTATGTLTDTDVDNPFNTFTAVGPTPSTHGYGSFAMTAAGVWTYTLNNANGAVQALNAGGILTDSFTVTTVDGTPQVVSITITGSNDSAVISGTTTGAVIEAGSATPGTPTATGTLIDADVDNPANTFTAVGPTPSAQGYGSFSMTAAGVWTYTLDNANSAVQALNAGNILTDSFTVTTVDGTPQVVTITITGSNDSAVISGTTTGAVTETGSATPGMPTATGTLIDTDVDNPLQHLHGGRTDAERAGLRQFCDDGGRRVDLHARQCQQRRAGAQCRRHPDRQLHGDHRGRHPPGGDDHHHRQQRFGRHFRHHDRRGDRDRQRHAGHADRDRHAHRYRRRQSGQHLHGSRTDAERAGLRQLCDDGGRRVDLHARQCQQRGAGAQCRRHADRQLHGHHRGRHPTGGDDHHHRQQRLGRHFRHHDRRGDRGRQRHAGHTDRDRHAHRYRRRQSAQHLHGGWTDAERAAATAALR